MDGAALGVWLASFAWMAWLIAHSRQKEIKVVETNVVNAAKVVKTEKGTRFVGS